MINNSLFQVALQHRELVQRLSDLDLDEKTLEDTLSAESWPLEVKTQNICYVIRNCQFEQAAIDNEIERLSKLRAQIAGREKNLRAYTWRCMEAAGVQKITAGTFAIAIQNNPPSVEVFEPGLVPAEFMTQPEAPPPAPNKTAIKEAIKAGREVPGAILVQGKRLAIK